MFVGNAPENAKTFGALMIFFGFKVGLQGFQESQVVRLIVSVAHASINNAFVHTSNVKRGLIPFLNPKSAPIFRNRPQLFRFRGIEDRPTKEKDFLRCSHSSLLLVHSCLRLSSTN